MIINLMLWYFLTSKMLIVTWVGSIASFKNDHVLGPSWRAKENKPKKERGKKRVCYFGDKL